MSLPGDPLHRRPTLEFVAEFAPTGIPVRIFCGEREVVELLDDALGFWKDFPVAVEWRARRPLTVRLVIHDITNSSATMEPIYRMPQANLLLIVLGPSVALADRNAGDATAYVTPSLLEDQEAFRYWLLQAILVFLLTPRDRLPLHAAALLKDNKGLLLSGPSGVGKTTLALAAARAGYQVLADDAVYVQRKPIFQIWGLSPYARLAHSALHAVPGAEGLIVKGAVSRKGKVLLDLRRGGCWPWPPAARVAALCAVVRGDAGPKLQPVSLNSLTTTLLDTLPTGFDLFRNELKELLLSWPGEHGWKLCLPPEPEDVLPLIEEMLWQIQVP